MDCRVVEYHPNLGNLMANTASIAPKHVAQLGGQNSASHHHAPIEEEEQQVQTVSETGCIDPMVLMMNQGNQVPPSDPSPQLGASQSMDSHEGDGFWIKLSAAMPEPDGTPPAEPSATEHIPAGHSGQATHSSVSCTPEAQAGQSQAPMPEFSGYSNGGHSAKATHHSVSRMPGTQAMQTQSPILNVSEYVNRDQLAQGSHYIMSYTPEIQAVQTQSVIQNVSNYNNRRQSAQATHHSARPGAQGVQSHYRIPNATEYIHGEQPAHANQHSASRTPAPQGVQSQPPIQNAAEYFHRGQSAEVYHSSVNYIFGVQPAQSQPTIQNFSEHFNRGQPAQVVTSQQPITNAAEYCNMGQPAQAIYPSVRCFQAAESQRPTLPVPRYANSPRSEESYRKLEREHPELYVLPAGTPGIGRNPSGLYAYLPLSKKYEVIPYAINPARTLASHPAIDTEIPTIGLPWLIAKYGQKPMPAEEEALDDNEKEKEKKGTAEQPANTGENSQATQSVETTTRLVNGAQRKIAIPRRRINRSRRQ
ncbi:hypothetical protein K470DRAFT_270714 [Piedraia hortae CBS 480.64]|uniref:Uncharacterized protein n=1 Tax=Piedraia hortae CBS 480.64 TaxID=1314780 RepID=A0A6A7BZJ9_9PEZI|nr:hypothetical protein K470DRAFT_270714 [Piedraia hortae CBS 480.64]